MKKKLLASILALSLVATAGMSVAACVAFKDKPASETTQTQPSNDQVTDENGNALTETVNAMPARMTFRNARAISGEGEYEGVTIQATIKPDNATNKNVSWSVDFVNPNSDWAKGKDVGDYVAITPQSEGSNIATVECLQPFGEQIKITVTSLSNPNAKAESTVDFARRIVSVPFDVRCFEENYNLLNQDFSMDALYLDVGISWDLWIEEPACVYTDYTVRDDFSTVFEIIANENIVAQFTTDTGISPVLKTLSRDDGEGAIYGALSNILTEVNWNDSSAYNALNDWLAENTDKAMFTLRYKAVGEYSTYEAEVPIYLSTESLEVLVTEIILNQSNLIF